MKRKSKDNEDIVIKILKGMVKNEEKVVKDLFAQRLKANIMRHRTKDAEMSIATLTDYLNNISANKRNIREEDVQREYDSWWEHDWEKNKVANQVIDRMLYKGIWRLTNWLTKESGPSAVGTPESKLQKVKSRDLSDFSASNKDIEEEKTGIFKELSMRKNNSQQPTLGNDFEVKIGSLDLIDEAEDSSKMSVTIEPLDLRSSSKTQMPKLRRKDSDAKRAEEDTDEEIIDTNQ